MSDATTKARTEAGTQSDAGAWLAAIVENTHDAILSKTLDGIITSWNGGAERLFGFTAEEAVGQPITLIIPDDRLHEEERIIARLREGQRVERFETVRRNRDGEPVHIEVTISPVRDAAGTIIGASKIARDISERKRHAADQALLVREMHHRIKNLLSIVQSLIGVGRRRASDVEDFADELNGRIGALAAAQSIVLKDAGERPEKLATVGSLLEHVLAPYADERVSLQACDLQVGEHSLTSLALLFHELATNAAKYGGLASPTGSLSVNIHAQRDRVAILWRERGGHSPDDAHQGFGTGLLKATLRRLDGTIDRTWDDAMLEIHLELSAAAIAK